MSAEAIFDGFGPFWGWFSLCDLLLADGLTLVTEFIGMPPRWRFSASRNSSPLNARLSRVRAPIAVKGVTWINTPLPRIRY